MRTFVDEFDDPNLGGWIKQYGTAFAADGFLHLTSPGTPLPNAFGVLPGTTLDLSLVGSGRQVFNGEGSFVAHSYWEPDDLGPGDFNHMSLNTLPGPGMEVAGLAITNRTADGDPTTYTIVQHLIRFTAGGPEPPQLTTVPIDPGAITGQIVFELRLRIDVRQLERLVERRLPVRVAAKELGVSPSSFLRLARQHYGGANGAAAMAGAL